MRDELKKMIVDAIIHSMKDGDSRLRCYSAKTLGMMRSDEAIEPLIGLLKDPDPDVRCDVATALGEIGDRRVVPSLIPLLEDKDLFVRVSAIQSMAKIGDPLAIEPLIQAMTSTPHIPVILGELSGDYGWEIREKAISALAGMKDKRVVQALADFLKDGDADMWQGAIFKSLVQSGDRPVPAGSKQGKGIEVVAGYLKDPDTAVRRRASGAFLYAQDPSVPVPAGLKQGVEYLKWALTDEDSLVKVNLIEAIGRLGDEKDMASLIPLLKDRDNDVRLKAMEIIARIGGRKPAPAEPAPPLNFALKQVQGQIQGMRGCKQGAVEYILPLLHDPASGIRRKAVELLGDVGDKDCVEPLINALKDTDKGVCGEAIGALANIGDERAVKPIIAILKDKKKDKDLRTKAIFALGRLKTLEGLQAILALAADKGEEPQLRHIAIHSLTYFDERAVIDGITPILKGGDNIFKIGVSRVLRDFKNPEVNDLLLSILTDKDEEVRKEVAMALAYRGKEIGLVVLSPLMKAEKGDDFSEICDAIKNIKGERAVELLMNGLKGENPSIRCASLRAIGQIGDQGLAPEGFNLGLAGPVIGLLADTSGEVRREAVVALGRLGYKGALRPLVTAIFDYDRFANLRQEIVTALKGIDQEGAIVLLLERLKDKRDKANHWVAIEALSMVLTPNPLPSL